MQKIDIITKLIALTQNENSGFVMGDQQEIIIHKRVLRLRTKNTCVVYILLYVFCLGKP